MCVGVWVCVCVCVCVCGCGCVCVGVGVGSRGKVVMYIAIENFLTLLLCSIVVYVSCT